MYNSYAGIILRLLAATELSVEVDIDIAGLVWAWIIVVLNGVCASEGKMLSSNPTGAYLFPEGNDLRTNLTHLQTHLQERILIIEAHT